jgi:hypothetical protein
MQNIDQNMVTFLRRTFRGAILVGNVACATAPSGTGDGRTGSSGASSSGASSSSGTNGDASTSSGTGSDAGSGSSGSSSSGAADASAMESGSGLADCTDMASSAGTLAQQFGSAELLVGATKSYFLQSNWWQTYSNETEDYTGLSFTVHNPQNASVPPSNGSPMGFPSIFIGQYAGHSTQGSNLPKQVSALTSIPTTYETKNSAIGTTNHNAAYDVWFTQNGAPLPANQGNPGAGGAYLMVWMFKPTDRQPRGSDSAHTGQTVAGVSGTWNVWIDNTSPPCISYVSSTPIDGLKFDLNDFIKDAVAKRYGITSSMYLSVVFGGFEIWGGADGIKLNQFCASVN